MEIRLLDVASGHVYDVPGRAATGAVTVIPKSGTCTIPPKSPPKRVMTTRLPCCPDSVSSIPSSIKRKPAEPPIMTGR